MSTQLESLAREAARECMRVFGFDAVNTERIFAEKIARTLAPLAEREPAPSDREWALDAGTEILRAQRSAQLGIGPTFDAERIADILTRRRTEHDDAKAPSGEEWSSVWAHREALVELDLLIGNLLSMGPGQPNWGRSTTEVIEELVQVSTERDDAVRELVEAAREAKTTISLRAPLGFRWGCAYRRLDTALARLDAMEESP